MIASGSCAGTRFAASLMPTQGIVSTPIDSKNRQRCSLKNGCRPMHNALIRTIYRAPGAKFRGPVHDSAVTCVTGTLLLHDARHGSRTRSRMSDRQPGPDLRALEGAYQIVGELRGAPDTNRFVARRRHDGAE